MKFFKKKIHKRGVGKSPETKSKEQQAKVDEFLSKTYLKYLREHPTFAEQIAREKFGLTEPEGYEGYEGGGAESPDFLEKVREVKNAMDLIKGEFGGEEKTSGVVGFFKDFIQSDKEGNIAKSIAGVISKVTQGLENQPSQLEPAPKQIEQPTQQETLYSLAERLLSREPKEAAAEIYQFRNQKTEIRGILFKAMTENEFDYLVSMLPVVSAIPEYAFLQPLTAKLDEKWLAATYDEVNALKKQENAGKSSLNEGKPVESI